MVKTHLPGAVYREWNEPPVLKELTNLGAERWNMLTRPNATFT
jgi:hypothetical protein